MVYNSSLLALVSALLSICEAVPMDRIPYHQSHVHPLESNMNSNEYLTGQTHQQYSDVNYGQHPGSTEQQNVNYLYGQPLYHFNYGAESSLPYYIDNHHGTAPGPSAHHVDAHHMSGMWNSVPSGYADQQNLASNNFHLNLDPQAGSHPDMGMYMNQQQRFMNDNPDMLRAHPVSQRQASGSSHPHIHDEESQQPPRLQAFEWQKSFDQRTLLKIYRNVISHWPPMGRYTARNSLERLGAYLEGDTDQIERILKKDEVAIKLAVSETIPKGRYTQMEENDEDVQTVPNMLKHLQLKDNDFKPGRKEHPKWAPLEMGYEARKEFVTALQKAWRKDKVCVKARLMRMGPEFIGRYADGVLSKVPGVSRSAISQMDDTWSKLGRIKQSIAQHTRALRKYNPLSLTSRPVEEHQEIIRQKMTELEAILGSEHHYQQQDQQQAQQPPNVPMSANEYQDHHESMENLEAQFSDHGPESFCLDPNDGTWLYH